MLRTVLIKNMFSFLIKSCMIIAKVANLFDGNKNIKLNLKIKNKYTQVINGIIEIQ